MRHIIRHLRLKGVEVIEKRIEDEGIQGLLIPFDIVLTRALFSIKDFIKKASPIVKKGGLLVVSKGPAVLEELDELKGSTITYSLLPTALPLTSDVKRYIVIIKV